MEGCLIDDLCRYIGQTVTIFTTSGGLSGDGFTGVLAAVTDSTVKLITYIGAAPSCPVGSTCTGGYNGRYGGYGCSGNYGGFGGGCGCNRGGCGCNRGGCDGGYEYAGNNWLGSVTEIPICRIASFTHNAI